MPNLKIEDSVFKCPCASQKDFNAKNEQLADHITKEFVKAMYVSNKCAGASMIILAKICALLINEYGEDKKNKIEVEKQFVLLLENEIGAIVQ